MASILRAEGFALALDKVFRVASVVDSKTMNLQYLEALRALGAGPATKFVIPVELTTLLRPFLDDTTASTEHRGMRTEGVCGEVRPL